MAQIATITMATGDGTQLIDVPVYDPADVEGEMLRVETPSGVGAINVTSTADADIDQLRVQTASGVKAVRSDVTYPPGWRVTSSAPGWNADWDAAVQNEFGSNFVVADWNDLKTINSDSTWDFQRFKTNQFPSVGADRHVYRNGNQYYQSDRAYFASRHDGDTPDHYMVHANINNNEIDLGSWDSNHRVLCYDSTRWP